MAGASLSVTDGSCTMIGRRLIQAGWGKAGRQFPMRDNREILKHAAPGDSWPHSHGAFVAAGIGSGLAAGHTNVGRAFQRVCGDVLRQTDLKTAVFAGTYLCSA